MRNLFRTNRRPAPVPDALPVDLFDQAVYATGTLPDPSPSLDVDVLLAEMDLLALPLATGTLTIGGQRVLA